ncbi:MAG: hypothetical protein ACOCX4_10100, partial [Planctomycetota bacterium]
AGSLAKVAGEAKPERGVEYYVFLGAGLVATIAATAVITRIARKSLRDTAGETLLEHQQPGEADGAAGG